MFEENPSRATVRQLERGECLAIVSNSSRTAADTLVHIINYADNRGFAVVSAAKCDEPLLAFIPEGNYSHEMLDSIPPFAILMEGMTSFVAQTRAIGPVNRDSLVRPPYEPDYWNYAVVADTSYFYQDGKLKNRWHQGAPFGNCCPNQIAGCVPLAISMVLTHFAPEGSIEYTYPGADLQRETPDWDMIKICESTHDELGICHSSASHKTLARLIRQIGKYADAQYKSDRTGVPTQNITKPLGKLLPNCIISSVNPYDSNDISDAIKASGMVIMRGDLYPDLEDGHTWVVSGMNERIIHSRHYRWYGEYLNPGDSSPIPPFAELTGHEYLIRRFLYMNLGWGGSCNGWYNHFLEGAICFERGDKDQVFINLEQITVIPK